MRFEVSLGNVGSPPTCRPTPPQPTGLEGMDGRYGIRFDALDLHAGQEAELSLHVLRDGTPAPDLTPYLGVAAHAVFISAADLTYVHAHAAPAAAQTAGGTGSPMMHDMTGMTGMAMPGMGHAGGPADGHGAMPGMGGAPMRPGTLVPPNLALHVRAPKAGTYPLWFSSWLAGRSAPCLSWSPRRETGRISYGCPGRRTGTPNHLCRCYPGTGVHPCPGKSRLCCSSR